MVSEILAEIGHEFTAEPMRMIAEMVQFVLLIVIVWVVAVGFGKRRGFVVNMLAEREAATRERIAAAYRSPMALNLAKKEAAARRRQARTEARDLVAEARTEAARIERESTEQADAEAAALIARAEEALATEIAEMQAGLRGELVELVTQSTRAMMNERMTVSEQRSLIEGAVSASVADLESAAPAARQLAETTAATARPRTAGGRHAHS